MNSEIFEHIKFILIDSINDDVQGIYELNWAVKNHYSELEFLNGKDFLCGKVLVELISENYVKVIKMTNPEFKEIESLEMEIGKIVVMDKNNWTEYQNDWIYGIETLNEKKSIELENKLYEKIKTLHNNV